MDDLERLLRERMAEVEAKRDTVYKQYVQAVEVRDRELRRLNNEIEALDRLITALHGTLNTLYPEPDVELDWEHSERECPECSGMGTNYDDLGCGTACPACKGTGKVKTEAGHAA